MNQQLCSGGCPFGTILAGTAKDYGDLAGWRTATGLDANSVSTETATGLPTSGSQIFVRPNQYEPGRANIIVYNWGAAASVAVDLSSVLRPGDQYEVRNVQAFFGTPVDSGTYAGGTIQLPMTNLQPPPPIGGGTFPVTGPLFNVFVVRRPGS